MLDCYVMSHPYKRVLLKLSGEQLAGSKEHGIDTAFATWLAEQLKPVQESGSEIVIMVGGGNFVRGASVSGNGIKRVTGDHMGMLATMINALALTDIFESTGLKTRCLSSIFAVQVAEPFVHRLANKHMEKGRVVIVAGGSGRPYVTTDTAAVVLALELDCDVVLKATKVNGVYDRDPAKHDTATKFDALTYQEALGNNQIKVMDKAALGLAMEQKMPIIIFDTLQTDNLVNVIAGKAVGTKIS